MLVSGGAAGADTLFETSSKNIGHGKIIYTGKSYAELTCQKDTLDDYLTRVNDLYLARTYPTKNEGTNNLLRRNVLVALVSDVMYAVGYLSKSGVIEGGTAWASYVFIDKCINTLESRGFASTRMIIPFYFFDQNERKWFCTEVISRQHKFTTTGVVPKIKDITSGIKYGGIGSRDLTDQGTQAIKGLFV